MRKKTIENTLFLGNGFSRAIFEMPEWGELFGMSAPNNIRTTIQNYTILYEAFRLSQENEKLAENDIKRTLVSKIKEIIAQKKIKNNILDLSHFGEYLSMHHVHNIITTNYDTGIELILCQLCGYKEVHPKEMEPERIYSIRTYKVFSNACTNHSVKLWKIHGDVERIKSVTLGFDQYCSSLSKLVEYIKGNYKTTQKDKDVGCLVPIDKKCKEQKFDGLSWAELFFRSNVYIVGFGMAFSEIDIWWLLNKRARLMLNIPEITNTITFLNNPAYEDENKKPELFAALQAFKVSSKPIISDNNYISNIFNSIE